MSDASEAKFVQLIELRGGVADGRTLMVDVQTSRLVIPKQVATGFVPVTYQRTAEYSAEGAQIWRCED